MRNRAPIHIVLLSVCLFVVIATSNTQTTAQSARDQASLYFFTNAACGPCRMVEPHVEQLYRDGYSVMKIDTMLHPDWTQRFQVQKTPTVMLVAGNKVLARHSGYIDSQTMKKWFASANSQPKPQTFTTDSRRSPVTSQPKSDTIHQGTYQPGNNVEQLALQATVKLKIDDPTGTSYATGTVIHSVDGESLVLTCGHVFRDSNGLGTITAEYGFASHQIQSAKGELLFYDADARDIGLVAISTKVPVQPVPLAAATYEVTKGAEIFSIGCDQGNRPSIRRSKVKNQAKYDGIVKYEIFGRPVNGRSGGGMFTSDGKLIGVCNAAVVDVDEGVYVALDTIHWQIEKVNLVHLFQQESPISTGTSQFSSPSTRLAQVDESIRSPRSFDAVPVRIPNSRMMNQPDLKARQVVYNNESESDNELIIVLRNRETGQHNESWTIANPSNELIRELKQSQETAPISFGGSDRIAKLRRDMPKLPQATGKTYNSSRLRAQSPR